MELKIHEETKEEELDVDVNGIKRKLNTYVNLFTYIVTRTSRIVRFTSITRSRLSLLNILTI